MVGKLFGYRNTGPPRAQVPGRPLSDRKRDRHKSPRDRTHRERDHAREWRMRKRPAGCHVDVVPPRRASQARVAAGPAAAPSSRQVPAAAAPRASAVATATASAAIGAREAALEESSMKLAQETLRLRWQLREQQDMGKADWEGMTTRAHEAENRAEDAKNFEAIEASFRLTAEEEVRELRRDLRAALARPCAKCSVRRMEVPLRQRRFF